MPLTNAARDALLAAPPFGLPEDEKRALYLDAMRALTAHHAAGSPEYARLAAGAFPKDAARLADIPFVPVRLFKSHELRSIPKADVFKTLASSGTTQQRPSKVVLDRDTAMLQSRTLANELSTVLSQSRMPMAIIDAPAGSSPQINARHAAMLGVMSFGRDYLFCLDESLTLQKDAMLAWLQKHAEKPVAVFGFTFMVWKCLYELVADGEIDLSRATLLHTGGWKKLQSESVTNEVFRAKLRARTGLTKIHNFYGMAEQAGTVLLECEQGLLHAPTAMEIIIRDPRSLEPVAPGGSGVVQVMSVVPTSYPGHSLLTEDLAELVLEDGCACGRHGVAVKILGRIPQAEVRGCSDVMAQKLETAA